MNIRSIMKMCCNHIGINSSTHTCKNILRCQERQSGGTECKKTLQRAGLRPEPRWGSLQRAPPDPIASGEVDWLPPLQQPPTQGPSGLAFPVPHSKIMPLSTLLTLSYRLRLKLVFSCKVGVYCFCAEFGYWLYLNSS